MTGDKRPQAQYPRGRGGYEAPATPFELPVMTPGPAQGARFAASAPGFNDGHGVEVTVIVRDLDGKPGTHSCTQRVSHELAIDARLETPLIEDVAVRLVREIAEGVLGDARHEMRERERLERMLGGPATVERMAAHLSQLLDEAGDAEYRRLAARGRLEPMWTPGADPYAEEESGGRDQ